MDIEKITWKTMPAPTDAKIWPCMVCRQELATHRRILRRKEVIVSLIVCLECGRLPDARLWHELEPKTIETPLAHILRRLAD